MHHQWIVMHPRCIASLRWLAPWTARPTPTQPPPGARSGSGPSPPTPLTPQIQRHTKLKSVGPPTGRGVKETLGAWAGSTRLRTEAIPPRSPLLLLRLRLLLDHPLVQLLVLLDLGQGHRPLA